jgi:hypothetical protein
MPLNASNVDVRVNFIEYWESGGAKVQHFSWVTDLRVSKRNVFHLMRGGRARWKIENETFNTLKNQGYNFAMVRTKSDGDSTVRPKFVIRGVLFHPTRLKG